MEGERPKHPGGRPPNPDPENNKTIKVGFACSKAEREWLKQRAAEDGLSSNFSVWLREQVGLKGEG